MKIGNSFWDDVLRAWCKYNYQNKDRVENQIIWYNSRIRMAGKPFFWRDCYLRGLLYVYQFFDENKNFRSSEYMYTHYGVTQMRYWGIQKAIPKEWRDIFQSLSLSQISPIAPHNYDKCLNKTDGLSKEIYQCLNDDILLVHDKYLMWSRQYGWRLLWWYIGFCQNTTATIFGNQYTEIQEFPVPTPSRSFGHEYKS